jgi:hypothetical protein
MAFELKILNPKEDGFIKEILWNHQELMYEVQKKVAEYKDLVYTDEQIPEAKKDRATLNKLAQALDVKRKEIKKMCLIPADKFAEQVNEIIAVINEPIAMIDKQLSEYDEMKKQEKQKEIENIFSEIGFPSYVSLAVIYNQKWMNKTYSLKQIKEEMLQRKQQISTAELTIKALPAFSQEAMVLFERTLDLTEAITEAKRLTDIQKEAEERRKAEVEKAVSTADKEKEKLPEDVENVEDDFVPTSEPAAEPRMRRQRVVIEIVANEAQFGAINTFYTQLKHQAESVRIIEKENI